MAHLLFKKITPVPCSTRWKGWCNDLTIGVGPLRCKRVQYDYAQSIFCTSENDLAGFSWNSFDAFKQWVGIWQFIWQYFSMIRVFVSSCVLFSFVHAVCKGKDNYIRCQRPRIKVPSFGVWLFDLKNYTFASMSWYLWHCRSPQSLCSEEKM